MTIFFTSMIVISILFALHVPNFYLICLSILLAGWNIAETIRDSRDRKDEIDDNIDNLLKAILELKNK